MKDADFVAKVEEELKTQGGDPVIERLILISKESLERLNNWTATRRELDRLAKFILGNFSLKIDPNKSVVDTAIELLQKQSEKRIIVP